MAKKKYRPFIRNKFLLLILLIIIFLIYCYLPLAVKIRRLNKLIENIDREIVFFTEDNCLLEKEKDRLTTDLDYIGRLAREKLDLIRPGEIIYKIVDKKSRGGAAR